MIWRWILIIWRRNSNIWPKNSNSSLSDCAHMFAIYIILQLKIKSIALFFCLFVCILCLRENLSHRWLCYMLLYDSSAVLIMIFILHFFLLFFLFLIAISDVDCE